MGLANFGFVLFLVANELRDFSRALMGVLTSHFAPIGGAFCLFYKSLVLMPHLSPGWGKGVKLTCA